MNSYNWVLLLVPVVGVAMILVGLRFTSRDFRPPRPTKRPAHPERIESEYPDW